MGYKSDVDFYSTYMKNFSGESHSGHRNRIPVRGQSNSQISFIWACSSRLLVMTLSLLNLPELYLLQGYLPSDGSCCPIFFGDAFPVLLPTTSARARTSAKLKPDFTGVHVGFELCGCCVSHSHSCQPKYFCTRRWHVEIRTAG
jgi:hypothetical protein